jgi:hypothetical protein
MLSSLSSFSSSFFSSLGASAAAPPDAAAAPPPALTIIAPPPTAPTITCTRSSIVHQGVLMMEKNYRYAKHKHIKHIYLIITTSLPRSIVSTTFNCFLIQKHHR